jgi:ribokinase
LVLGSCILDVHFFVDRLPMHGESLVARSGERRLGGKGFNQAVALARLGCDVTFVCGVGKDEIAQSFHMRAEKEGIDFRPEAVASAATGVAAPVITPDGVSTIVVDAGASMHLGAAHLMAVLGDGPWDAALCHFEVPAVCLRVLFDRCEALGVRVVCNPAPWNSEKALEFVRRANIVVLNSVEAELFAQDAGIEIEAGLPLALAMSCGDFCPGELLVVTLGSEGSIAISDHEASLCETFQVEAVDSTGAGDAFCAGLVYGIVHGWTRQRTLALASATAALACTLPGGSDAMPQFNLAFALASTHRLWGSN